jgi:hypothetical protein
MRPIISSVTAPKEVEGRLKTLSTAAEGAGIDGFVSKS